MWPGYFSEFEDHFVRMAARRGFSRDPHGVLLIPNLESVFGAESKAVLGHQLCKMLERAVISPLGICGKATSRELPAAQVITQAIAAHGLFRTWFIGTITLIGI